MEYSMFLNQLESVVTVKAVKEKSYRYKQFDTLVNSSQKLTELVRAICEIDEMPGEVFGVILVDAKNKINAVHICTSGMLSECMISPREVFRAAILANANSVFLFHNHPSGDPTPSAADIHATKMLIEAGKVMQIKVHDHVVIGQWGSHYSMAEHDLI